MWDEGACGGVHCKESDTLEPMRALRNVVAMLMARMVGLPLLSQSAM